MKIHFLGLFFLIFGISAALKAEFFLPGKLMPGIVSLKADNGLYLARCFGCGQASYKDSAGVHETNPYNPWSMWKLEIVGDKVALKSDNGNYLSRCNSCWSSASYKDAVFVHVGVLENNPWSLWKPQRLNNGKWAFKSDNGMYLTRCNSCVTNGAYADFAFTHVSNLNGNPWSQWTLQYRFPLGPVSLQADTGAYLLRCSKCGDSPYEVSAGIN